MDRAGSGLCYLITLVATVILAVYGFMNVLKDKQKSENNDAVVQRQLRGFGLLVLAQIVLLFGASLCYGTSRAGLDVLRTLGLA